MIDIHSFWSAVLRQDAQAMRSFFAPDACINWHNTNEHFTLEEFIRANCQYPGDWAGTVERVLWAGNTVITATHVHTVDGTLSFHVTSFIRVEDDKITAIDEYWGDDGPPPQWRQMLGIGSPIRK